MVRTLSLPHKCACRKEGIRYEVEHVFLPLEMGYTVGVLWTDGMGRLSQGAECAHSVTGQGL